MHFFTDGVRWVLRTLKGGRVVWPHAAPVSMQDPEQAWGRKSTHLCNTELPRDGGVPKPEWAQDHQPSLGKADLSTPPPGLQSCCSGRGPRLNISHELLGVSSLCPRETSQNLSEGIRPYISRRAQNASMSLAAV